MSPGEPLPLPASDSSLYRAADNDAESLNKRPAHANNTSRPSHGAALTTTPWSTVAMTTEQPRQISRTDGSEILAASDLRACDVVRMKDADGNVTEPTVKAVKAIDRWSTELDLLDEAGASLVTVHLRPETLVTVVRPHEHVLRTSSPAVVEGTATLRPLFYDRDTVPFPFSEGHRVEMVNVANAPVQSDSDYDKQMRINHDEMSLLVNGSLVWNADHLRARVAGVTTSEGGFLVFYVTDRSRNEEQKVGEWPVDLNDRHAVARSALHLFTLCSI